MSDKKSILVKAILDKTGITKGVKEIQAVLNRTRLSLHTKFDTRDAEKQLQATMKKAEKQYKQKQTSPKTAPVSVKTDDAKTNSSSTSPPRTKSSTESGGLIRLFGKISTSPFLATAGFSSDACEACLPCGLSHQLAD